MAKKFLRPIKVATVPPTRTIGVRVPVELAAQLDEARQRARTAGFELDVVAAFMMTIRALIREADGLPAAAAVEAK